jgi:hypothetical protein
MDPEFVNDFMIAAAPPGPARIVTLLLVVGAIVASAHILKILLPFPRWMVALDVKVDDALPIVLITGLLM